MANINNNMNTLDLPVSFGEAIDKLSILEIKLENIHDSRKADVEREYLLLNNKLNQYLSDDISFHYTILKEINKNIWDMQDVFRESTNHEEKVILCIKIIEENDRRFRVKKKLNYLFQSHLCEQKGYNPKQAFVLSHLGLGDCFTISPAIRYLSTIYDNVVVVCKEKYVNNVKLLYQDDPSITFHIVNNDSDISPNYDCPMELFQSITTNYDLYTCGFHKIDKATINVSNIPFCFYKDLQIDTNYFWKYFYIPFTDISKTLYKNLESKPYAIIHNQSSTGECFTTEYVEKTFEISKESTIFINVNKNIYPQGHPFYSLAEQFVNIPLIYYKDVLIHAEYVCLSDSSLFCMAINLPIQTDNCYVVSRKVDYSYLYESEYACSPYSNKPRFITLIY